MTFHIGQEVCCIKDFERGVWGYGTETTPIKGEKYTIREIKQAFGESYLRFREIRNPEKKYMDGNIVSITEPCFHTDHFRPVIKTNISIFTEILERENVPSTEKEKV